MKPPTSKTITSDQGRPSMLMTKYDPATGERKSWYVGPAKDANWDKALTYARHAKVLGPDLKKSNAETQKWLDDHVPKKLQPMYMWAAFQRESPTDAADAKRSKVGATYLPGVLPIPVPYVTLGADQLFKWYGPPPEIIRRNINLNTQVRNDFIMSRGTMGGRSPQLIRDMNVNAPAGSNLPEVNQQNYDEAMGPNSDFGQWLSDSEHPTFQGETLDRWTEGKSETVPPAGLKGTQAAGAGGGAAAGTTEGPSFSAKEKKHLDDLDKSMGLSP
jgi:hypothetical protein